NVPSEVQAWRQEIADEQDRLKSEGRKHSWNGPTYALEGFVVGRQGVDENPEATLRLSDSDYYTYLAAQQLDRTMRDGKTLREKHLAPFEFSQIPPFMLCSFGTNMVVVTADDYVLFSMRSHRVRGNEGTWSVSANEALSRSLDSRGRSAPNL